MKTGYANININNGGISFWSDSLDECKSMCRQGYKVVKTTERRNGFSIKVTHWPGRKLELGWRKSLSCIALFRLMIVFSPQYRTVYGDEVWRPE